MLSSEGRAASAWESPFKSRWALWPAKNNHQRHWESNCGASKRMWCGGGPESLLTCRSKADWTLSPCPLGKSKVSTYTMTSVKATVSKYDVCFIPPPFFVEQHAHCREMKQTSITKSASSCSVLWSKRLIIICIFIISVQGGPLEAHFPSFLSSLLDRTSV